MNKRTIENKYGTGRFKNNNNNLKPPQHLTQLSEHEDDEDKMSVEDALRATNENEEEIYENNPELKNTSLNITQI